MELLLLLRHCIPGFCMHLKCALSLIQIHNIISHRVLPICKNYRIFAWVYSGTSAVRNKHSDDVPMSYICRNTLLLLLMGFGLMWPYIVCMLDILPFDDLMSYM
jgi:hypothetical protein